MRKKYEFVNDDTIEVDGITLTRIRSLVDIPCVVTAGDLGGYLEDEENLSHSGQCWVGDNAWVMNNARVLNDASVSGDAEVMSDAIVSGEARVLGAAIISDSAHILN